MKYHISLRTSLFRKLCLICLMGFISLTNINSQPSIGSFGVWDRGETMDINEYPFIKGSSCDASWNQVEKMSGVYDWSQLDQAVERASMNKTSIYISFAAGPESPDWIYTNGVPKVVTDNIRHAEKFPHYPFYISPEYQTYYHRFLTEAAKHIKSYPEEKRKTIAFIQVKTGCTGDECAYKGEPLDQKFSLEKSDPKWKKFRLETFEFYAKLFYLDTDLKISLLLNSVTLESEGVKNEYVEEWNWATTTLKDGFGIKNGALSRGHHLSGERLAVNDFLPYLVDPKGLTLFRRSEMDQTWTRPWYQLNVPLNFYWGAINALNSGQSVWDITNVAIKASKEYGFDYTFYFFNKYAGQIFPETATNAFCALHKGLDAADTIAYPENFFGQAKKDNVVRMEKICASYSKYGAANDDKKALTFGQVQQRGDQTGFNDVGWEIWPDNYSRFLYQIAPDETSIPLWRIGGRITDTSSIYSRFARGFEHSTGKDALYFKLHEGFSQDAKPKVMSITVVWYDSIAGSTWKLDYDAGNANMKTAITVIGKGDKKWHHEAVTLNDAVFRCGGTKGSDLALVNTDDKDDIFSLIEVHRGEQVLPLLRPPAEVRVIKGYEKGIKYGEEGDESVRIKKKMDGEKNMEGDKQKKDKKKN